MGWLQDFFVGKVDPHPIFGRMSENERRSRSARNQYLDEWITRAQAEKENYRNILNSGGFTKDAMFQNFYNSAMIHLLTAKKETEDAPDDVLRQKALEGLVKDFLATGDGTPMDQKRRMIYREAFSGVLRKLKSDGILSTMFSGVSDEYFDMIMDKNKVVSNRFLIVQGGLGGREDVVKEHTSAKDVVSVAYSLARPTSPIYVYGFLSDGRKVKIFTVQYGVSIGNGGLADSGLQYLEHVPWQ